MNDKLQQLYNLYKQKGIINTTDFNTFASASDAQRQKLYDLGVQKGLFNTTDFNTFNNAWSGGKQEPLKKKESTDLGSKSEKPTSVSSSKRRFEGVTEEPISQKKVRTDDYIDQVQNAQKKQIKPQVKAVNTLAPNATEQTVDVLTTKEANQMMAEDFGEKEFKAYSSINKLPSANKLKDLDEETTADILNKQFEGTNLEFKKLGWQLTVTSKIGDGINSTILNEKTIDLSEPDADKELKSFISTNLVKKSEREQFENAQSIEDLVQLVGSNPNKFKASLLEGMDVDSYFEKERDILNVEMARAKADTYNSDLKSYEQKVARFNQEVKAGKMTKADFDAMSVELENERKSLTQRRDIMSRVIDRAEKIDDLTSNLEEAKVITTAERERQGSLTGLVLRGVGEGLTDVSQAMIDFGIAGAAAVTDAKTLADAISPGEYDRLKRLGFSDDEIKNEIQKSVKNKANQVLRSVPDVFGMGTTEEYAKSSDRGVIEQAAYAIGESLGALGSGVATAGSTAGFFAMSYNALEDQMRGPQFDALSENEKKIMSVPYGLVIGALEKLGAKVAAGAATNKTLGMFSEYIMAKTFSSLPTNASILEIKSAIDKSVALSIANGMLKITGAGVVEGGTEFTQQIFEGIEKDVANRIIQSNQLEAAKKEGGGTVSKEIYDEIVKNKFFKDAADLSTAEGIGQLLKESGNAFIVGAVAGGMGSTASVGVVDPITNKISNNRFAVYRDIILNDNAREGAISSINKKVEDNEITREQADNEIKSINEAYPVLRQIPTNFSVGAQREAFGLLTERERLNKEIEDKDPNLVAKQKERVAEINEQLKGLSYAVQEQSADAVPVQSGAGVSTEVEKGVSETKPEGVTGETITEEVKVEGTQAEQPQAEVTQEEIVQSEENQALIDAYVQEQTNLINEIYGDRNQEAKQEVLDELTSDPIAFANKRKENESESNFLNSLQRQPAAQETAVAEEAQQPTEKLTVNPSEGYSFEYESENDVPAELRGVEPTGRTETKVGRGKNAKIKLKLTFTGQQLIDAGLAVTPEVQETVQETVQTEPTAKIETIEVQEVPQVEQVLDDLTQQNNVLTENDFTAARIRNVGKEKVVAQIQKAAKAIAKVLPKVKIVVHATPEAFVEATKDMDGRLSEGGLYDHQTGQIHINLERANNRTVAHEVFHALILSMVKSDVEAQRLTRSMIKSVLKSLKKAEGTAELISYLEEFESNYDENIKNEEKLGELFGVLADNYKALPPASKNIIIRFLNRLAKALGLKEMTDREAIQFMNTLSRKVETGQEIEAREVGKQKEGKAAIRKQIIGEVGAKRLDQQENSTLRMDNLQVAKDMKDEGKTPKEIRTATGWEMGAEGKWRYETVDNLPFFNDVVNKVRDLIDNKLNQYPLLGISDKAIVSEKASDILPAELIKMYPELNQYTIDFGIGDDYTGNINLENKTIRVNIDLGVEKNKINSVKVLLHEVQHAIQEIEGFDSGTNAQRIVDQFIAQDNAFKNRINRIINTSPDSPLLDAVINQRKAFIDNFSTVNKNNQKVLNSFDLYMRKAGEIEARNVMARMNMTADERRNTLLTETEDIKDRQIIEDRNTRKFAVRKQKGDVVKSKIDEDWEHTITLNGKKIGKIFYDKSQKTWNNAEFDRSSEKAYTYKSVYGDVVGENKKEAIDEMVRRYKEKEAKTMPPTQEAKIKYTNDQITNNFLNALNEKSDVFRNPIDNRSFIYGDKAFLEFSRFDKGDRNEIAIQSISTFDKGKGVGKQVMKDITDTADELGVTLTLDAKPFGNEGLSKEQLINFYKKNGFVADIEEMFGGEFESEEELIDYVINEEPEAALQMTREPSTRQFAVRKQKLAPNGKPSNLDDRQWEQVRTPEFKAWFGDWENDPEKASKVVDENGEPLVVSHFTDQKFDVFKYKEGGFHFGDASLKEDLEIAKGKNLPIELKVFLNIKSPLRIEDSPRFFAEDILKQLERESEYLLSDETIDDLYGKFIDIDEGNFQDPETKKSNELIKEVEKLGIDGYIYENKFDSQDSKSSYIIDEENSKIYMRNEGVVVVGDVKKLENTNARPFITFSSKSGSEYYAEKNEADEINESDKKRIKELIDDGNIIYTINSPKTSSDFELFTGPQQFNDSYIAFQPNQIKSATENVGTFSEREFSIRKQKTTGPSRIVEDGVKAGKTDADIRQEGRAAGFTNKEMTEALSKYYTKEQGIFMKSGIKGKIGKFVDFAKRWKQKYLTTKGLLSKAGFTYKEKMEGEISAEANRAAKTAKKFGLMFDKFTGDKDLLLKAFDKVLRGDKSIQLPTGFAGLANEMRNHIDRLSQMLIATGAVDADMADTIRNNMGTYITRSYEIFDNKNFRQKIGEQELQAAKNFLRTQPGMIELAKSEASRTGVTVDEALDALVDNKIDEYFADAETGALIKGSKLGSKDLSTLKERKEIPEQIRMLMGEYSDPAMNYARTVLNIATLAARHQFLTQVKEAGMGKFFFEKNDSQRPKGFDTEIAAEGSETMSPLNGLMTTPEIAEAFGLYDGQKGKDSWYSQLSRIYYKAMGLVKWLKTIGSVGTHAKNIFSNFTFVGVNGHSLAEIGKAIKVVAQDLKTMSKPEVEAKIDEYIKAGIMRQGAGINEIKDMFKDADMDNFLERRLSMKKPKGIIGKIKQVVSSKTYKLKTAMEDLYQAEDDMFKIAAYETEMNRYADALYNKPKDQLTDKERQEVSDIAANNVKNTYPTYSRIPEGIKRLRRFPLFIGSFISFQAESYRTAYNTIGLAKDELSSDNEKIRKIGAKRVAGAFAYLTAKTAILSYLGYAAGTGFGGLLGSLFDDDDEKKKQKDVRNFLPPWSKNSDLIILKAADGEIEYIDFSASDAYGGINKALNALLNGEDLLDSFKQSTLELVGQFQGPDILTNLAIQLKQNENDFGKPIYNEEDSLYEKTDKILDYVYKVIEPGTFTSIRKGANSEQSLGQIAFGDLTGLKVRKSNVKDQFGYKLSEFDDSFSDIRRKYNSEYYKTLRMIEDPKISNKEVDLQKDITDEAFINANKDYAKKAKELMALINSANRLGVDYDELIDELEKIKGNMGKSNIYEMEDEGEEFINEKEY